MSFQLPFKPNSRIIELGGGDKPLKLDGLTVVNVDVRQVPGVDIVANLEEDFSDIGVFDGLFSQYLIEHIGWRKINQFLLSCFKVLKPDSYAVFVMPDTEEQMKLVLSKPEWDLSVSQMIFGDQNYGDNAHKVAFSKTLIAKLLKDAGFDSVEIKAHPDPNARDMFVLAHKKGIKMNGVYERKYFEGVPWVETGYRDHIIHYATTRIVAEDYKPESVLELGGARGYISKHLQEWGILSTCIDISKHCYYTRATDDFILLDLANEVIPLSDKSKDLAFSMAFLEHIPPDKIDHVIRESIRVSKRGLHGITFIIHDDDFDETHRLGTIQTKDWWIAKFKEIDPNYPVTIMDKEELEPGDSIPIPVSDGGLVKFNLGSFTEMFANGWVNTDIIDLTTFANRYYYRFVQMDCSKPLPINDNTVDLIVSHHMLEHLTRIDGEKLLQECLRILKPNGIIRFSVPDTKRLANKYVEGKIRDYAVINEGVENSSDDAEAFFNLSISGHLTYYDGEALKKLFEKVGLKNVDVMAFNKSRSRNIELETIDSFPEISVFVEGTKDAPIKSDLQRYLDGETGGGVQ